MVGVRFPALVKQMRLEDLRVVCINDDTIGLLEITNEVLKHPDLHLEQRFDIIVLDHLVEQPCRSCFSSQNAVTVGLRQLS